jgi:dTDP-4-dehydrorhamnose reductase
MKTLIFGPGFLGTRIAETLPGAVLSRADIADGAQVEQALRDHAPQAVINAAGKTGRPNVDWCETHQQATTRSNVVGPLVLARACEATDTYLLHLASGCIFYGDSPQPGGWTENNFANPVSFYSRSKYAADLLLGSMANVAVVRLRMPIDGVPGDRNLVTKLARYPQVVDVANSVTVVDDLMTVIQGLVERRAFGIFHATNPGLLRHTELLTLYRELVDPDHSYRVISESELLKGGYVAKQRSNCQLASPRLRALGLEMRPVHSAVREAMVRYGAQI